VQTNSLSEADYRNFERTDFALSLQQPFKLKYILTVVLFATHVVS